MDTFSKLLLKHTNCSEIIDSVVNSPPSMMSSFEFWSKVYSVEIQECLPSKSFMQNTLLYTYIAATTRHNPQSKYQYFKNIMCNPFMNINIKEQFIDAFQKSQRNYAAFRRVANQFKYRRAKTGITTDLYMNPIREHERNVISIIQHDTKYLFTIVDLIRTIETALTHSPDFFSQPLASKNPYNNLPFQKSTLYNIYFFIRNSDVIMPTMVHNYFLANFSLKRFQLENEVAIRRLYIKRHIHTSATAALYKDIIKMLNQRNARYRQKYHIEIDVDFPKQKLVTIMKPYLEMHYCSKYSLDSNERYSSTYMLDVALHRFNKFNPNFGERREIAMNRKPAETVYNDRYIEFISPNRESNYQNSHLEIEMEIDAHYINQYTELASIRIPTESNNYDTGYLTNSSGDDYDEEDEGMYDP
jgi:hypothetical protein